ncbi:MAG: hypothetical protein LYZ66_01945 [Nitrososphaerales archaeon]|nr:hypothetical protein [Nitrososphaerales archaeon]
MKAALESNGGSVAAASLGQGERSALDAATVEPKPRVLTRRSQLEIRMDMLKAVKEGAEKPTQIMYKANLSWVALQTHLKSLLEKGLLHWVTEGTRKRYELTIKGSNVMYSYAKILEEVGQEVDSFFEIPHTFAH